MSVIIETEATSDSQGGVHLYLPTKTPNSRLSLRVEIDPAPEAGRFSKRFATRAEYQAALGKIFGACDDPTFVPPPDQPLQDVAPL